MEPQNKAFLMKLLYQLSSQPNSLWVQVLKRKYKIGDRMVYSPRQHSSYFWRNLAKVCDDTSLYIKWHPSSSVKFWSDNWIGDSGPLQFLSYAAIPVADLDKPLTAFINSHGHWEQSLFAHLLPGPLTREILKIPPSDIPSVASCLWSLTSSGTFSVKSAYHALESLHWNDRESKWSRLWTLPMAQRVKTFIWLLLRESLLTNVERKRRGMAADDRCTLCHGGVESINHVFRDCTLASSVWKKILPLNLCQDFFRMHTTDWICSTLRSNRLPVSWKIGICLLCWKLWQVRNRRLFCQESFTTDGILLHIQTLVRHTLHSFSFLRNTL